MNLNRWLALLLLGAVIGSPPPAAADEAVPQLNRVSRKVLISGKLFRIWGTNLGERELWYGGPPITIDNTYNVVTGWADDRIFATIPLEIRAGRHELVVVRNRVSGKPLAVTVAPVILSAVRGEGGRQILVQGGGYGPQQLDSTVTVNGRAVTPVKWGRTAISLPADAVAEKSVTIVVTVEGLPASFTGNFDAGLSVDRVVIRAGLQDTELLVAGSGFGPAVDGELSLNDQPLRITNWSTDAISAVVPPGLKAGSYPLFFRNGAQNLHPAKVTVIPTIRGLSFADGRPGDDLELHGAHFPDKVTEVRVSIGSTVAEILSVSRERIQIRIPPQTLIGEQLLRVTVAAGGLSSPAVPFKVLPASGKIIRFEEFQPE